MAIKYLSVVATGAGKLLVNTRQKNHCQQCKLSAGCGLRLLQRTSNADRQNLLFPMPASLKGRVFPGSLVRLQIDAKQLILLSLLQYLIPLFCLLAGTLLAGEIVVAMGIGEIWVILAALAALFFGLVIVKLISKITALISSEFFSITGDRKY